MAAWGMFLAVPLLFAIFHRIYLQDIINFERYTLSNKKILAEYMYIYRIQPKLFLQSLVRTHFFMQIFISQHEFAAKHKILFTCICVIMYNNNKRYYQELVFWHYQNPIVYKLSIMITLFTLFCTGYIYNIFSNCN